MADNKRASPPLIALSSEALFRYLVVSAVQTQRLAGRTRAEAVKQVDGELFITPDGQSKPAKRRSIYRWLKELEASGLSALETERPGPRPDFISEALRPEFCDFLRAEKKLDRYASVPELIRRAKLRGVIGPDQEVDRTSVWRACRRMQLPLRRLPSKHEADQRPWDYPHRMQCLLADGKFFRAGVGRKKRVAIFFLDKASRYGLDVVVGTAESALLFLRGLFLVVQSFGFFDIIYLDGGPGFIALDTIAVVKNLGGFLIHGRHRYPEGHGAIERFNQTADQQCLRGLPGALEVDPECGALELRLRHYLREQYDLQPHEALGGLTPQARWDADSRPLRFPDDEQNLRERFMVSASRKVSQDNVIPFEGVDYEVPRGHAGTPIHFWRRVLTGELLFVHDGSLVTLHPVDRFQNALERRARPLAPPPEADEGTPTTAAQLAFARDFGPVVGPDGDYLPPKNKE
jgi:hypothetical protein